MESRPGFDVSNVDQTKRLLKQQEQVNRSVLSKQVRVVSIPNNEKLPVKELAKKFLNDIVRYNEKTDLNALGWLKSAGSNNGTSSFRAEMSASFWDFFLEKGKKNLMEYNKRNNTAIKLIRGQTVHVSDVENLSLYLRKKIRQYCIDNQLKAPEISISNGYMSIKNPSTSSHLKIKSTELAITLGWSYDDWNGAPIKEMLTDAELKSFQEGRIKWGCSTLESLMSSSNSLENNPQERMKRKRGIDVEARVSQKVPRCEESNREDK